MTALRRAALVLLMVVGMPSVGAAEVRPPQPCGPVVRPFDVVEIASPFLRRVNRIPIDHFVLVARRGEQVAPIPFQIDERRGRKVASTGGDEPDDDDQPGIMDPDDVLVFMACDAGERTTPDQLAAAVGGTITVWREITLRDDVGKTTAWAYLVATDRPTAQGRHYAAYEPAFDRVTTAAYRVGCVRALPVDFAFGGPAAPNLLDGIRLRATAALAGNLAQWSLTERGGGHELVGWTEGPVRVVRRSRHTVKLGLGIEISAGYATTYFYPRHVYGPGSMKLPVSPSVFFREITALAGVDLRDLRGWRYHASGVTGFRVDGQLDDQERALAGTGTWFVLDEGRRAFMVVLTMSDNLRRAAPLELVYLDDAATPYPPELEPGTVPLVGWRGKHLERLTPDKYKFQLHIFFMEPYRQGDEHAVLAALAHPLAVAVNGPGLPEAAPTVRR